MPWVDWWWWQSNCPGWSQKEWWESNPQDRKSLQCIGKLLCNSSKKVVISSAESSGGVHHTAGAWTAAVVDVCAKLQLDVWHTGLDCYRKDRTVNVADECLGIVQEDDMFLITFCRGRCRCGTSDTSDGWGNARRFGSSRDRILDLPLDGFLPCAIKISVVGGGKILALGEVLLLLLAFVMDTLDYLLGIFEDAWISSIWAFDHMNAVLKERPRMRSPTTIAMKKASRGARKFVGPAVLAAAAAVAGDCLLRLTGVSLGREGLIIKTIYFACNCIYIVILHLCMESSLEHFLKGFALVSGGAILRLAIIREVSVEAGHETRVKAIN